MRYCQYNVIYYKKGKKIFGDKELMQALTTE